MNDVSPPPYLIVRADASPLMGGGHIMRTVTLANALKQRGWRVTFATTATSLKMAGAMGLSDFDTVILTDAQKYDPRALRNALPDGCKILLVDHYALDLEYTHTLRGWAQHIVVIDDLANREHDCDILVDQTYGRNPRDYTSLTPAPCSILAGTNYALLRPEFFTLRHQTIRHRLTRSTVTNVIVSAGMTDPKNITKTILDGIVQSNLDLNGVVVLGSASQNLESISSYVKSLGEKFSLHVDSRDMALLMTQADLAIGASGTTAWERCCLGLPTLALITADNQNVIANTLSAANISKNLGPVEHLDAAIIATALKDYCEDGERHREIVLSSALACDGLGTARTCIALDPEYDRRGRSVTTRPVTAADSEMIFAWQHEPNMRRYFKVPTPPTQSEHDAWFHNKLADPLNVFEITLVDGTPAGILRLDPVANTTATYEISILVSTPFQGNAIATASLKNARRLIPHALFNAEVDPQNTASEKSFLSAGFSRLGDILVSEPK